MGRIKTIGGSTLIAWCLATGAVAESGASSGATAPAQSAGPDHAAAERCAGLQAPSHRWPDSTTRITSANWHPADSKVSTQSGPVSLPAHCEVTGILRERTGEDGQPYAIRFHLRLPEAWNQRFFFQGGGGTNGELGDALGPISMGTPNALQRGYAVVSQDSGHDNARNTLPERGGPVAFGFDPQARADYGGASLEPVAQAAKAILAAYYGRGPERSYFVGCSKGGQEGMMFAQRHPEQFDGIVASAPGFSLPRAAVAEAWDIQAFASLIPGTNPSPDKLPATFSREQFARVRKAVLAACDADDGAHDGITANWAACEWSRVEPQLQKEVCSTSPDCLSAEQVNVIGRVYSGAKDSKGRSLYASWPFDGGIGSDGWRVWKIGPAGGPFPGINVAMGAPALAVLFTTPPTVVRADLSEAFRFALQFDFDRDAPKIYATHGPFTHSAWDDVAARSTDLRKFRARGAKMIVPHGVSDPVFSINDTVAWYREVDRLNGGRAADFVRVFPVPGMAHCSGGPATDQFDAFDALVAWVERGTPPDRLIATAGPASPWPGRTRPLCPYPKVARYSGEGSLEDATQFRCE
ncbi:MAG: tannase/feruloyl esterase family alpha/beta hydrolase [Steroidobacteraceae bacterium]|nr:tannase/feruloyl esterase family alpha/beta hydrolase [Steroidobacteraceae bacterium]